LPGYGCGGIMGERLMSVPGRPGDLAMLPSRTLPLETFTVNPWWSVVRRRGRRAYPCVPLLASEPLLSRSEAARDPERDLPSVLDSVRGGRLLYEIGGWGGAWVGCAGRRCWSSCSFIL
jgi:hypothetical protein